MRLEHCAGTSAAILVALSSCAPASAGQQNPTVRGDESGLAREIGFYAGVVLAPREIGRDLNRAGGDVLIARLGDSGAAGARFEARTRFVGGGFSVFAWARPVTVRNDAGVRFPNHGERPLLYMWDVRLYPCGESIRGGRVLPYVGAGFGGALISVDLDNVDDQELRHLWARGVSAGVKLLFNDGDNFLDIQYKASFLSGRGPIASFDVRAIVIGFGGRY